jgi:CNT family concentrative nucleoside transporter
MAPIEDGRGVDVPGEVDKQITDREPRAQEAIERLGGDPTPNEFHAPASPGSRHRFIEIEGDHRHPIGRHLDVPKQERQRTATHRTQAKDDDPVGKNRHGQTSRVQQPPDHPGPANMTKPQGYQASAPETPRFLGEAVYPVPAVAGATVTITTSGQGEQMGDLTRFQGLLGVAAILTIAWLLSENRRAISARMVLGGLALQCGLGAFLLRSSAGRRALDAAAAWVAAVLDCALEGASFLFGPKLVAADGPAGFVFAFRVLPTIIFVAALFAVLYHLGIMQFVVRGVAWVTARLLGSSGAETLNAAASIFLGQTEAPLTIRPFLARLTRSELLVVMVSGMGLVSGGMLAAYIGFIGGGEGPLRDAASRNLLTAILMTFPATIYLTKIFVPETGQPETSGSLAIDETRPDANLIDAATRGTREGLLLAANVGAVLIAFIALVTLVNMGLGWLGGWAGDPDLSVERILGLLLAPVAWLIGVPWSDAGTVGGLLGIRTVANEVVAYEELGKLARGGLGEKSTMLATIAMCSFANLSSIGIQVGGIGALVPERRKDLARLGLKALLIATLATSLSAALAGAIA